MGKLILRNNGVETQFVNGINFSGLTAETNTYILGVNVSNGNFEKLNPDGQIINYDESATGGNIEVTYSELVDNITGGTLTTGTFYTITDYRTCYDQPDFTYNGNPITVGNYKQGPVEPILVLAISSNTISDVAYQPSYPNDKIRYDWTFNITEVTSGTSFGRITERIDEFNNRTDYDHRNILFKRYKLFTYREELRINGTVEILSGGTVSGTNTTFSSLTVGDVIYTNNVSPSYFEIVSISGNTLMTVSGDTITTTGPGAIIYNTIEETNDSEGYFSYKRTNVKTNDYLEYTTFGDAISQNYAKNTYIGNYANNYTNIGSDTFILSNNVFLEGAYESNKFGDYCYNNTFGTDNSNNIWGDYCYGNVSTNDIDDCVFKDSFNNNLINTNLTENQIGANFNNNRLLAENSSGFRYNIIGNDFNNNTIYSDFYDNQILNDFNGNTIGDFGNVGDTFNVYRNRIGQNFNNNIIRQDFQNNSIGNNYQQNIVNGEFKGNTILNGFNNNETSHQFELNQIGNGFNENKVNDDFRRNDIGYYFYSNLISNDFEANNIGEFFENNEPFSTNLFGWNDLSTVSTRTYNVFNLVVGGGGLGNRLLGKELVMKVISTSQYFKIKFTQWTQGNNENPNGGGFQYERQEIDSNGNPIGDLITFTKTNYGNEVDIIVPGVVEITRGIQNGIYNVVSEGGWDSNVSPQDTEWNSIYTVPNNGSNFRYNQIGNDFQNNNIGNNFQDNQIRNDFRNNNITNDFRSNVIGSSFESNDILDGFGFGGSQYRGNKIGNYFYNNNIGEYFYDNTISDNFTNNSIGDNFQWNNVNTSVEFEDFTTNYGNITGFSYSYMGDPASDNTYFNIGGETNGHGINASFDIVVSGGSVVDVTLVNAGTLYLCGNTITILGTSIGGYNDAINSFTDNLTTQTGTTGNYTNIPATGGNGVNASFDVDVDVAGLITNVNINLNGEGYTINDILTINGSLFGGTDGVDDIEITVTDIITSNFVINVGGVSANPSVYELYNCEIFKNSSLTNRLSYYDGSDVLTIKNINE